MNLYIILTLIALIFICGYKIGKCKGYIEGSDDINKLKDKIDKEN